MLTQKLFCHKSVSSHTHTNTHKTSTYNKHRFGVIPFPVWAHVRACLSLYVFCRFACVFGILDRADHEKTPTVAGRERSSAYVGLQDLPNG